MVSAHKGFPLHNIEEYNGSFFQKSALASLGLRIHLLHEGSKCPNIIQNDYDGTECLIGHTNGFHKIRVSFCNCPNHPSKVDQLVIENLFPASVDDPRTLFTFQILKDFHLQTRISKKSAYDYLRAIRRKTDGALVNNVSVSEFGYNISLVN